MIAILIQAATNADYELLYKVLPFVGGGLAGSFLTLLYNRILNRIQKMHCQYIDDDVISKIPVVTDRGSHQSIHTKEFVLINTTNKDIAAFRIIFEFDAQSKIIRNDTFCKAGKNFFEAELTKDNECSIVITNYNRKDEVKFRFDIANLSKDVLNITEADCIGFKIVVKDKRKSHKKNHGKIVRKEDIK